MKQRLLLWGLLIVLLIISLPGLFLRWETEVNNNTYELAVPYEEIYDLTIEDTVILDEALEVLKDAGLNTISFSPISLERWQAQDILTIYGQKELERALMFTHQKVDYHQDKKGFYITVPEDPYYVKKINEHFNPVQMVINNQALYFIPTETEDNKDRYSLLGYDEEAIAKVKEYGFNYILRIENDKNEDINQETIEELLIHKDDPQLSTLLFTGEEVIGYPSPDLIKQSAWQLYDAGFSFYSIEFSDLKGMQTFARATDYNTIRLHSMNLRGLTPDVAVDRAIRAVKERNIRTIFFRPDPGEPIESLEGAIEFISTVHNEMPKQFVSGTPTPFEKVNVPIWSKIAVLLAGILFTYLAAGILNKRLIEIAAGLFMALLVAAYVLLSKLVFLQAFGLIIAIVTPIYALLSHGVKGSNQLIKITSYYVRAIVIGAIGIIILVGALNGNGFISGFEIFRGVKLVYIVPLIFVTLYIMWDRNKKVSPGGVVTILNHPVKYWHVVVILLISGIGFYYITRTGNAGSVTSTELIFRQWLEEALYVRPRFKEFFIGFPIYILALYVMGIPGVGPVANFLKKWGKLLLIPGIIGFLSIVNTFSHFHIPLHISLLRTAYSVVLGYVFGILFIMIFAVAYRYISRVFKKRWS